jgi:hypothetical protein
MKKAIFGVPILAVACVLALGVALTAALPANAQTTIVSGTVLDPQGIPYAKGNIRAQLISPGGPSPKFNGATFNTAPGPVGLNNAGTFSIVLPRNGSITPAATKWKFTVCGPSPGNPAPLGTGTPCFSIAPVTIAGATQDISAQLKAAALPLSVFALGGTVVSFKGRSGVVIPQTGDYTAAQITNALDTSLQQDRGTLYAPLGFPQNFGQVASSAANTQGLAGFQAPSTLPVLSTSRVILTTADLLALKGTPIEILPAANRGQTNQVLFVTLTYRAGASGYTVGAPDNFRIFYSGSTSTYPIELVPATGFIDGTTSNVARAGQRITTGVNVQIAPLAASETQPLMIENDGAGEWTAGDGWVDVQVFYSVTQSIYLPTGGLGISMSPFIVNGGDSSVATISFSENPPAGSQVITMTSDSIYATFPGGATYVCTPAENCHLPGITVVTTNPPANVVAHITVTFVNSSTTANLTIRHI